MMKNRKIGLWILILILTFVTVACSSGGSSEPTQAPPPAEPTAAPVEPTAVPIEPTEVSEEPTDISEPTDAAAEEPTEVPAGEPTEEPTEARPKATKTPPPENELYVESINSYWDIFGAMHVVGLVTNATNETFDNVEVEIKVSDSNQTMLYNTNVFIDLANLAPGETSTFSHQVNQDISDPESYATAAIFSQNATEVERSTLRITGTSHVVDDVGFVHVIGKLVNNTLSPVIINSLAAATYDENDNLITAGPYTALVFYLDPGEDSPFRITMTGPAGESSIDDHDVYLDAITALPLEYYDLSISENHHYYLDASGGFHLIGDITNNYEEYLTVSLVASIYDEDGDVVDANTTEIPTFSIAPGETLPYDFQYWGPLDNKSGTFEVARNYFVQYDPYWIFSSPMGHVELTTKNDTHQMQDSSLAYFTGEVLNNSNDDVRSATIIISLFNLESENLVATGYGLAVDPIAPNATSAYEVWIDLPAEFDLDSVKIDIAAKGDLP